MPPDAIVTAVASSPVPTIILPFCMKLTPVTLPPLFTVYTWVNSGVAAPEANAVVPARSKKPPASIVIFSAIGLSLTSSVLTTAKVPPADTIVFLT